MDTKSEVRDFLTSRRGRITPEQAGVTTFGQRRVPGLRREEVATLAGVSVDYSNRIERGNLSGASEGALVALAEALQLDEAERVHLHDLARRTAQVTDAPAILKTHRPAEREVDARFDHRLGGVCRERAT
jgi:transcriptional regulator with XRE-family HTH domain